MLITINLTNASELQVQLAALPDAVHKAVVANSQVLAESLAQYIQDDKLDGQVLANKTGRLRNSIESNVDENSGTVNGGVSVAGDVPYAAIQEYGGTTKAHIIEASQAKVLAFSWQGKAAFFKRVNHHGSTIPERSYLRSALEDMENAIVTGIARASNDAIEDL